MTNPLLHSLLGLALASLAAAAWSQTAAARPIPNGRLLASNCFQCHGTDGRGPGFDEIAGESAAELVKKLKEYQSGEEGGGLMAKHAWGYSDAQLQALAMYLSRRRASDR